MHSSGYDGSSLPSSSGFGGGPHSAGGSSRGDDEAHEHHQHAAIVAEAFGMLPRAIDGLRSQLGRGAASGLSALARLLPPNDAPDGAAGDAAGAAADGLSKLNLTQNVRPQ